MTKEYPKSLELFERFRPRYEFVELETVPHWEQTVYAMQTESLRLKFMRLGKEVSWCDAYSFCSINLREAGVHLSFAFDRTRKQSIREQLLEAAQVAVQPLIAGRTIKIEPAEPFTQLSTGQKRKIRFSLPGEPIPGLSLPSDDVFKGMSGDWASFIPYDSNEGKAISAAYAHEAATVPDVSHAERKRQESSERLEAALAAAAIVL